MRRPLGGTAGRLRPALNESCHLRQDWDRISPGLSSLAIERGWWPEDGSKLDFAGALAQHDEADRRAYRWWGQATLLLEQQRGAVNHVLLRRLLNEPTASETAGAVATAGLIAQVGPAAESVPLAWCSFGPPQSGLYLPLPVVAEPPEAFRLTGAEADGCALWRRMTRDRKDRPLAAETRAALAELQGRFDQVAGEFSAEAAALSSAATPKGCGGWPSPSRNITGNASRRRGKACSRRKRRGRRRAEWTPCSVCSRRGRGNLAPTENPP